MEKKDQKWGNFVSRVVIFNQKVVLENQKETLKTKKVNYLVKLAVFSEK